MQNSNNSRRDTLSPFHPLNFSFRIYMLKDFIIIVVIRDDPDEKLDVLPNTRFISVKETLVPSRIKK